MSKPYLTDLVDGVWSGKTGGAVCWRKKITGDGLKLVEMVEARANGGHVPRLPLSRALKELGSPISPSVVHNHYSGSCSCGTRNR